MPNKPPEFIETVAYLVFCRRNKGWPRVRLDRTTLKQPALESGERAIRIVVRIPAKLFEPQGIPTANITVPESLVSEPAIEAEVLPFGDRGDA